MSDNNPELDALFQDANQEEIKETEKKGNAHARASAKYNKANYKTFSVNMKKEEYEKLCLLAGDCRIGKSRILIDLFNKLSDEEIEKLKTQYNNDTE